YCGKRRSQGAEACWQLPTDVVERYGVLFMKAWAVTATRRKHANVLQHAIEHMKDRLAPRERTELAGVLEDYRRGLVPLIVPITLMKQYVALYRIDYLRDQVYLNPHPKEVKLRNSN